MFDSKINNILLYTAFVYDKLNTLNTSNPVTLKATNGNNNKTSALDWNKDTIKIKEQKFRHIKIKLNLDSSNGIGIGEYEIRGEYCG